MLTLPVLQRLCWKECSRGWVMLALGLVLPPLAVFVENGHYPLLEEAPYINAFILMTAVVIWASTLAAESRAGTSYIAVHFPLSPALTTVMTFLLQLGIAMLIGLNIGCWPGTTGIMRLLPSPPLWSMLFIAGTFTMGFVVTLALSPWSGILVGAIWGIYSGMYSMQAMTGNSSQSPDNATPMIYLCFVLLVSLLGFLLLMLPKRWAMLPRRVLVCLLLGGAILGTPLYWLAQDHQRWQHITASTFTQRICSTDGSLAVEVTCGHSGNEVIELHFVDYRAGRLAVDTYAKDIQPLGFVGRSAVILAQQQPEDNHIKLLRWNLDANTTEMLGSIATQPGALGKTMQYIYAVKFAVMSPDERSLLISVPSRYNSVAVDLWCLDIQHRNIRLLKPAINLYTNFGCRNDGAVVSEGNRLLHVAIVSKRETSIPTPTLAEGQP